MFTTGKAIADEKSVFNDPEGICKLKHTSVNKHFNVFALY